jgi:hypothetical protein
MSLLRLGRKDPKVTVGAPYPPAVEHSDGPERPRRDVPTATPTVEESEAESEEEEDHR